MASSKRDDEKPLPGTYLVTGFPGFIGRRLVEQIARSDPKGHIYAVVMPRLLEDAKRFRDGLRGAMVELVEGDVVDMHLGLSGEEYQKLCDSVTDVFHLA